ncbi:hypothetical protein BHE74_00055707, partial [Ensete ventricosum]
MDDLEVQICLFAIFRNLVTNSFQRKHYQKIRKMSLSHTVVVTLYLGFISVQKRETRKKTIEDMDPETRSALENMKFYKFYPDQTSDVPDISKVKVCLF